MATQPKSKKAAVKKPASRSQKPVPVVKPKPVAKKATAKPVSKVPAATKPPIKPKPKPAAKAPSVSKTPTKPETVVKPKATTAKVKSQTLSAPQPKVAVVEPKPIAAAAEPTPEPAPALPPPVLVATPAPKSAVVEIHPSPKIIPPGAPLTVSVQSSQGAAANGNSHPANLLVVVTCAGWPVTELSKDHFTLMEHFEVPGQTAPFSNNITSFRNAGTGAYLLQIRPINAAPWRVGHHLGQLLISTPDDQQGQAAFKLIIR